MALVKFIDGLDDVRGTIHGLTFTGGNTCHTVRKHLIKVPALSSLQVKNQVRWGNLARAWIHTLTEAQRAGWRAYQNGTVWRNRFGKVIRLSGLNCFLRVNDLRLTYGLPGRFTAPTLHGHAGEVTLTFEARTLQQLLVLDEPGGAWDSTTDDETLYIAQGAPAHIGNISIPNRPRSAGILEGNSFLPPAFPYGIPATYALLPFQFVTLRVMHSDEFFRVGGPWYFSAVTEP